VKLAEGRPYADPEAAARRALPVRIQRVTGGIWRRAEAGYRVRLAGDAREWNLCEVYLAGADLFAKGAAK
jgi:hypothetical protein